MGGNLLKACCYNLTLQADEAIYARRNAAIEQERAIKENELNTEIAVENKKRQIREKQMETEMLVQEKRREIQEAEMSGKISLEEQNKALVLLSTANAREEADTKAYAVWEGALLPFTVPDLETVLPAVFNGKRRIRSVTMAKVTLNSGETLYGVNDLFIGPRSHSSARYTIEIGGSSENHSSSGIIVSTGLGSTGWFRSILTGATGIASSLSSRSKRKLKNNQAHSFAWDSDYLYFSVREPWPSTTSGAEIVFGKITSEAPLTLISQMPEHGVIFSDGMETDFLKFNAGSRAIITVAERKGRIVT